MSHVSTLRVLLWKESRVLMPLAVAVAALAVVLFAVTFVTPGDRGAVFYALLLLLPNLVAFGGPALSIGHEEESGTLAWQRALPSDWRSVFWSKAAIALLATLLVLVCCLAATGLAIVSGALGPMSRVEGFDRPAVEAYRLTTFTLLLLCTSLFCAWAFRHPAAGLLAVLPLMIAATVGVIALGYETAQLFEANAVSTSFWTGTWQLLLASVWLGLSAVAARRRWLRGRTFWQEVTAWWAQRGTSTAEAYLPHSAISLRQPGLRRAMLWQAVRQASTLYAAVFALTLGAVIVTLVSWGRSSGRVEPVWLILAAVISSWLLGVATFVGDSWNERYRFLAQRGVSRWTVWWTRVLGPLVCWAVVLIVLIGASLLIEPSLQERAPTSWFGAAGRGVSVFFALFCCGAISSMWAQRPLVGYFGGPLLLVPVFWWGAFVYEYYPEYFWTSAFALAVLLGVTLRMCRRWLDERRGAGYHARFAGWVALAALLVVLPIFLQRWWTTPAAMPEWRSATYAAAQRLELPPAGESMAFPIDTRFRPLAELSFLDEREREPLERAAAAVNGDNPPLLRVVDTNLSFRIRELLVAARGEFGLFGDGEPDDYYESLLEIGFHHVESLRRAPTLHRSYRADQCEFALAAELAAPESRTRLGEQAWRELVGRLRTPERRREDRRIALLFTWALSNTASMQRIDPVVEGERARQLLSDGKLIAWDDIAIWRFAEEVPSFDLDQRTFGAATWRGYRDQLTAERVRRGRFGDLAVRLSLEQLDTRLPPHNSPAAQRRREAWRAMQGMYSSRFRPTEFWSPEMEQPIEATRAMLEN